MVFSGQEKKRSPEGDDISLVDLLTGDSLLEQIALQEWRRQRRLWFQLSLRHCSSK